MPATGPGFDSILSQRTSLFKRIRENLTSVWSLPRVVLAAAGSANAAPVHLLDARSEKTNLRAQAGSTCLHALLFAGLIYAMAHPKPESLTLERLPYSAPRPAKTQEMASLGKDGSGGEQNPLPPTSGWRRSQGLCWRHRDCRTDAPIH